ncbi:extracellular metalloproteinase 1 [Batrachochytrium salamandrivorans]|nr:extracellular metalloproteinase 1 [Batrachochytrium salamandrivorans]
MADNSYKRSVASLDPSSTELPFYFPESVYESIPHSGAISLPSSEEDNIKTATDFISTRLNLGENDFKVVNSYTDPFGITHVYGTHMINGVGVSNHQAAAHVKNGQVTSFSTSFGTDQHFAKGDFIVSAAEATVDFAKASATASAQLNIPVYSDFEYTLEYVEQPDGKIVYAYKFQLRNSPVTKWVEVWCDAATGKVIQTVDFSNKASHKAIPVPSRDPTEGVSTVADPEKGVFDTKFNGGDEPSTVANVAAAAVNLFYVSNLMHDITYQYGFTEKAGNFQKDNFGKGGQGNDAVGINVLNTSKVNNANFLSPGDGQSGIMNIGCLRTDESGGMGEGWSDILALIVLAKSSDTATTSIPMEFMLWVKCGHLFSWEVYWSLVTKHGFSEDLYDASQSEGNIVAMKIIMGGMMLQPCNPSFLGARDAIIDADVNRYQGAHKCDIIKSICQAWPRPWGHRHPHK